MTKTNNTPKRTHIVKTRLDDEEHADFLHQVKIYGMNQSEFIREAISGATIRLVIVASNVNDARYECRKNDSLCKKGECYARKEKTKSYIEYFLRNRLKYSIRFAICIVKKYNLIEQTGRKCKKCAIKEGDLWISREINT